MSQEDQTTSNTAVPQLLGCDAKAQEIFATRYHHVHAFIITNLGSDLEWVDPLSTQARVAFAERFRWLEERITQLRSESRAERQAGRNKWINEYLLPIAHQTHLYRTARTTTLQRIWKRNAVAHLLAPGQWEEGEEPEFVFVRLRAAFSDQLTRNALARVLHQNGVSPDTETARALVDLVYRVDDQINKAAVSTARGLILSALEHGWIGLLRHSPYECTEGLLLLQRYADKIATLTSQPLDLLSTLRGDIIAFTYTIKQAVAKYQTSLSNLFQEPRSSLFRQRFNNFVTPEQRSQAIALFANHRGVSIEESSSLFESVVTAGLPQLIEARCSALFVVKAHFLEHQRVRESIERNLAALRQDAREKAIMLLGHMLDAAADTDFPLPVLRILDQHPSNPYRIRLGRRFSFSFGAMIRRRHRRIKRRDRRHIRHTAVNSGAQLDRTAEEDRFIEALTQRAALSPRKNNQEARTLLRYLLTYGPIGLFPRSDWYSLIDQRLVELLGLFKLGHLDGTLDWARVMSRVRAYAALLNKPAPSSTLARAIFNSLPKPPRWHGGTGEAVSLVRQRTSLVLDAPRLHQSWCAVVVKPRLRLMISDGPTTTQTCEVLAIIDTASQRPVSVWVSRTNIDAHDICLALYQAIWHPGAIYWPLRGIPEVLQIPQWLIGSREEDLKQSTTWMCIEIQTFGKAQQSKLLERTPYADNLLRNMALYAPEYIRRKVGTQQVSLQQAIELLHGWLHSNESDAANCFPHHRSSLVPGVCAQNGFLMSAHHFPGAGKLLPITVHNLPTGRDRIVYKGTIYTSAYYQVEPGKEVAVRDFPFRYTSNPISIFVEEKGGDIHFLEAQP